MTNVVTREGESDALALGGMQIHTALLKCVDTFAFQPHIDYAQLSLYFNLNFG